MQVININGVWLRFAVVLFLFFWFSPAVFAQSIPASELDGYAWSSNIGWISLNCKTGGATANDICATSNYKVSINADRTVSGYAWSSNIGWIKFNSLSLFPTGGGTNPVSANVTGTYPDLTFNGWARACAGTDAPTSTPLKDCSSMVTNPNSGGWDGWLSLGGSGYSVRTGSTGFLSNSFAWGNAVIGWVDMSAVLWIRPVASLTITGCTITVAGTNTCQGNATWSITNATTPSIHNTTTNTTYSTAASGTGVPATIRLGTNTVVARDGTFTLMTANPVASCGPGLTAVGGGGNCITIVATATAPTITIDAARKIARAGDTVSIDWTINPSPLASGTCTITGPGLTGNVTNSGTQASAVLRSKSRFTITCVGAYGTVSDTTDVEVIPSAQEV